jgi:hypothetical protein
VKVVMPIAISQLMRFRALTGADRFDEMWEGVLPSHASRLLGFFIEVWCPASGGAAVTQVNVSTQERWDQDYRIPDVSVMLPDRVPQGEAMFVRPNVVFEVRSPGDETYEKLSFYAAVGVEAVVGVELRAESTDGGSSLRSDPLHRVAHRGDGGSVLDEARHRAILAPAHAERESLRSRSQRVVG